MGLALSFYRFVCTVIQEVQPGQGIDIHVIYIVGLLDIVVC